MASFDDMPEEQTSLLEEVAQTTFAEQPAMKVSEEPLITVKEVKTDELAAIKKEVKKHSGADEAPMCFNCGNQTQRAGSCYVCSSCGSTTGCS